MTRIPAGHDSKDSVMDRRDALRKLGMGGATVVGASMVVSSPAFAFSASASPSVTPNLLPSFPERLRATFDLGTTCGSGGSVQSQETTFSLTITPLNTGYVRVFINGGSEVINGTAVYNNPTLGPGPGVGAVNIRKDLPDVFGPGEGATVRIDSNVTCTYPGGVGSDSGFDQQNITKP